MAETPPTYMRLAETIRRRIHDGEDGYREGDKLPAQREWAAEFGVAVFTLNRALDQLQVEGLIETSRRGTYVADAPAATSSSRERIARVLRSGSILAEGETLRVTSASLVIPPRYVAEIFDLDPGTRVVRREWVSGKGIKRTMLQVTWYPGHFASLVPDLLSEAREATAPHGSLLNKIELATGRRVKAGRDDMHAREADEREANLLAVRKHSPILAGAHRLWDDEGCIEYGEWCLPYRLVIGYEYNLESE